MGLEKSPRDHQIQLQTLHPWQECRKEWEGNILGTTRGVSVCLQAEKTQLQNTSSLESTQLNAFLPETKNERKRFQLSVKFPAPAPKHRRAGIIQRMSLQCSLSYQNEAFCLQLGLRNSRVVWMKRSRALQPLPEPQRGKFQPKDPSLAEEEKGAEGRAEILKFPVLLVSLGVFWTFPVHAGGLC